MCFFHFDMFHFINMEFFNSYWLISAMQSTFHQKLPIRYSVNITRFCVWTFNMLMWDLYLFDPQIIALRLHLYATIWIDITLTAFVFFLALFSNDFCASIINDYKWISIRNEFHLSCQEFVLCIHISYIYLCFMCWYYFWTYLCC